MRRGAVGTLFALAIALPAVIVGQAAATTTSVSSGVVTATLTSPDPAEYDCARAYWSLTILRGGATAFSGTPQGSKLCMTPDLPLQIAQLDPDPEPEIVITNFTGGAHCCFEATAYDFKGTYQPYSAEFGDPGFRLIDMDGNGTQEFQTADYSFGYRFTAFAYSGMPLKILTFTGSGFINVTAAFPAAIRSDAAAQWRRYTKLRKRKDGTSRGLAAAWAADQYLLGKRKQTLRTLRAEARRGRLREGKSSGYRFIKQLDGFLKRRDYA